MDLKTLTTLKTILEEGSFQKAASKLKYTQSTVTFQIQQLEQELSIKLFEKIGRRMVLTQAGRDILPHVDSILESVQKIRAYGQGTSGISGDLKVAIGESLLSYRMQPILQRFKERAPGVRLSLCSYNCYDIRDRLLKGDVDIGVLYDVGGYGNHFITSQLGSFAQTLVASPSLPKSAQDFVTPNQRIHTSLIVKEPECVFREGIEAYLKKKKLLMDNTIELWSIETVKRSVASSLGVTYLPVFAVERELAEGSLIQLPTEIEEPSIRAISAYHKNKWVSPAMELFIELTQEYLNAPDSQLTM